MEAQALDVVARILWADESGRIRIEPVVEARQQKPQRGTARELLAIAYRPAWAGPIAEVPEWDEAELAKIPAEVKPFFTKRNRRDWDFHGGNKPANMASEAPGMNPSRWDQA